MADGQAPLEADRLVESFHRAAVGTGEHRLPGGALHPGSRQHLGERDAGPLCRAHRADAPLLAGHRGLEADSSVTGAFQGDDGAVRWQGP